MSCIVVNASRGAVIDDDALVAALKSVLAAAGLDVYNNEPTNIHPGYRALPNVFLMPHIGSATKETRIAMGFRALDNLTPFLPEKNHATALLECFPLPHSLPAGRIRQTWMSGQIRAHTQEKSNPGKSVTNGNELSDGSRLVSRAIEQACSEFKRPVCACGVRQRRAFPCSYTHARSACPCASPLRKAKRIRRLAWAKHGRIFGKAASGESTTQLFLRSVNWVAGRFGLKNAGEVIGAAESAAWR